MLLNCRVAKMISSPAAAHRRNIGIIKEDDTIMAAAWWPLHLAALSERIDQSTELKYSTPPFQLIVVIFL